MSDPGNICWLASYPRSGNTWARLLLANALQVDPAEPVDINQLPFGDRAAVRDVIDEFLGVESADLPPDLWQRYWPDICRCISDASAGVTFLKTHARCHIDSASGRANLHDSTRGVVLIVRHPFDVAVSLAHHFGCSYDESIATMANDRFVLNQRDSGLLESVPEELGSWSGHLDSWLDSGLPLILIKYEDLHRDPVHELTRILEFSGFPVAPDRIARAIDNSRFINLQRQESTQHFRHGSNRSKTFFRGGRTGDGIEHLSEAQRARLTHEHRAALKKAGYA